ncbi:MAG: hypothetical protein IT379_33620 [Deltaproteobacteria bacterium]|nr:hypothetical protein [Deltaproteobacteria bacterium]
MRDHTWRWSDDDRALPVSLRDDGSSGRSLIEGVPSIVDDEPIELPLSGTLRALRAFAAIVLVGGAMAAAGWLVIGPRIAEVLGRI